MSFNATNKTGEVEPLPITDFLQFLPSIGAGIAVGLTAPLGNLISGLTKNAISASSKLVNPAPILPTKGISTIFSGLRAPTISTKALAGGALTIGGISVLSLTPGGQNLTNTTGSAVHDVAQVGSNITEFISKNPIVPIALIGLGVLIVIGVMKK